MNVIRHCSRPNLVYVKLRVVPLQPLSPLKKRFLIDVDFVQSHVDFVILLVYVHRRSQVNLFFLTLSVNGKTSPIAHTECVLTQSEFTYKPF
jgi:hypothetical protein